MKNPRILFYDIETMGEKGWYFPPRYETNILYVEHYEHLLSVAWKWQGEKKTHVIGLDDFPGYKKDRHNDRKLTEFIASLFTEANVVIAHNGNNFDQKLVQARIMVHKLPPPSPYWQIDTRREIKKVSRFPSNKLDDLGRQLELGQKLSHGNFEELWLACDRGDSKAWNIMKRYNKQDVVLLEQLYMELRPWISNHPAMNMFTEDMEACPKCGKGPMSRQGTRTNKTTIYQQFRCLNCGGWSRSRIAEKTEKPVYVN